MEVLNVTIGLNGRFRQTATVSNGRVRIGDTVTTRYGRTFVVEAIWVEQDRRIGNMTLLHGANGTEPVPASICTRTHAN